MDQGAVREQVTGSEDVLEVSGEEIPSLELADQIAVHRQIPITDPDSYVSEHQFHTYSGVCAAIAAGG